MPKNFAKNISIDKIAYWSVCLYVLDVVLLGTGDIARIAGVSTRMLFLAVALIASVPLFYKQGRHLLTNKGILLVAAFFGMMIISGVMGIIHQNDRGLLLGDIKGYLNFLILGPMMCTLTDKNRMMKLLKIVLNAIAFQVFASIFLSYLELYPSALKDFIYLHVNAKGLGILTGITTNSARIFLHSGTRMAGLGLLLGFAFWLLERDKPWLRYFQMTACLVLAFLSYARAVYLGLAVVVLLFLIVIVLRYKEYLRETIRKYIGVVALTLVTLLLIGMTQQTNLFKAALDRCLVAVMADTIEQPDVADSVDMNIGNLKAEVDSIEIREEREENAMENFFESPIWGNGLGVANDLENGTIEYFYLDLLSKMGMIGLILFLLPAIWAIYVIIKEKNKRSEEQRILSLVCWFGLLFLMVISYFNPCMNTSWGLMVYGLVITIAVPWKENIGD